LTIDVDVEDDDDDDGMALVLDRSNDLDNKFAIAGDGCAGRRGILMDASYSNKLLMSLLGH
jgi:hypothetical protein